ncbi:MAG: class I tRNA ligase family protein, partial [Patescibacteria group bacterium]
MQNYNHKKIEKKWQNIWEKQKAFQAQDPIKTKKKKFYSLIEFPYPSGEGLHVGHPRPYIGMDVISRKKRMDGYNVLYPIGWDAFGLPAENYAIKTGIHPKIVTKKNIKNFTKQIKAMGLSFDWSRETNTTDPEYYKWTQWIFLQFFKNNLAYKAKSEINWCIKCKIGLANEEVVNGKCERCGSATEKKEKEQWMLAITKYADRLDKDLDLVDYPDRVKTQQRNWIGKSEGSEIEFKVEGGVVKIFTTRADTIMGATFLVLAPEHGLVETLKDQIKNYTEVEKYILASKKKPDMSRMNDQAEKTGIELKGIKAINPANQEQIPIFIADYVLASYGTGAIMAVPQYDERDKVFAQKYNLPIIDRPLVDAKEITKKVGGKIVTKYKLRDWIFSRQRYWGEPIPMVSCQKCASAGDSAQAGWVPVREKDLPVELPEVEEYKPTETGDSP